MKYRYTAIADTPLLIRAKKSYLQSSDVSMLTEEPSLQTLLFMLYIFFHTISFLIIIRVD